MASVTPNSDSISEGQGFLSLFYVAINVENILYGIELFLYFKTICVLLRNRRARNRRANKRSLFYVIFSSVMLFSVTVFIATQAMFGQMMWLLDSGFPGGPSAYWRKYIAIWYVDWGTTTIIILQLMTDALMIHRCRVIWNSYRVVVVPIVLWFVTFVLGVLVDWTTSSPGGDYFTGVSTPLSLAYWSVSVFLCVILTSLICYRMVGHGRMVQQYLGKEHASTYFSFATIIIESVLLYTFSGIAALVSLGAKSTTSVVFVPVYFMMMCISPQMVIFWVATGKAWSNEAPSETSSAINFTHGTMENGRSLWPDTALPTLPNGYHSDMHDKPRISEV